MARRRQHYTISEEKSLEFAINRFQSAKLNGGIKGSPERIEGELSRILSLKAAIEKDISIIEQRLRDKEINDEIHARIEAIHKNDDAERRRKGILSYYFGGLSKEAESEIRSLLSKKPEESYRSLTFHEDISKLRDYSLNLSDYVAILEKAIPDAEQRERDRINARIRKNENKKLKDNKIKDEQERVTAMAAAHVGETRKLAQSVRRNIKHQLSILPICPYCSRSLGENPVADHIYPVKRGGLSTPENMVFVCWECNSKKKDLTLREFINIAGLDRSLIEHQLDTLGKRF